MLVKPGLLSSLYLASMLMPALAWADKTPNHSFKVGLAVADIYGLYQRSSTDDSGIGFLFLEYEGERFHINDGGLFYDVLKTDQLQLSLLAESNHFGYEDDSLDIFRGMEERDADVDLGLRLAWSVGKGQVITSATADAAGAHNSAIFNLRYEHPFEFTRWRITPEIGLRRFDEKFTTYYYGVLNREATATRAAYTADSATIYHAGIDTRYQISKRFELKGAIYTHTVPDTIKNSPLTKNRSSNSLAVFGVSYAF